MSFIKALKLYYKPVVGFKKEYDDKVVFARVGSKLTSPVPIKIRLIILTDYDILYHLQL